MPECGIDRECLHHMNSDGLVALVRVHRQRLVWVLPAAYTLGWAFYVAISGQWQRVLDTWRTALTMLFGSFVGGSTPLGSGAVAFPMFTKVLDFTSPVARTFALSIQATGLVMASLTILLAGRAIDRRAIAIGSTGGLLGFFIGAYGLSDPSTLWWEPLIPAAYIKVGFTIAIAAMAIVVHRCFSGGAAGHEGIEQWTRRPSSALFVFSIAGGMASALVGSGVNVYMFLFLVMIAGTHPRVGIPTSIITMALISIAGFVVFGLVDGQLATTLDANGDVTHVGGTLVDPPLAGDRYDLFGIWLGASVVVVWGAPFGAWVASVVGERSLIRFVGAMAIAEVITTVIFLDQLRTDAALLAFAVFGLISAFVAVELLARSRSWFMAAPGEPDAQDEKTSISADELTH